MTDTNKLLEIIKAGKDVNLLTTKDLKPKVEVINTERPVKVNGATVVELKGRDLSDGLQGTLKQRMEGERTIWIRVVAGEQPEVIFTGFWSGKFIRAAQNSISRAYRRRKFKPYRTPQVEVVAKEV